jgi:hypothetical protein
MIETELACFKMQGQSGAAEAAKLGQVHLGEAPEDTGFDNGAIRIDEQPIWLAGRSFRPGQPWNANGEMSASRRDGSVLIRHLSERGWSSILGVWPRSLPRDVLNQRQAARSKIQRRPFQPGRICPAANFGRSELVSPDTATMSADRKPLPVNKTAMTADK